MLEHDCIFKSIGESICNNCDRKDENVAITSLFIAWERKNICKEVRLIKIRLKRSH